MVLGAINAERTRHPRAEAVEDRLLRERGIERELHVFRALPVHRPRLVAVNRKREDSAFHNSKRYLPFFCSVGGSDLVNNRFFFSFYGAFKERVRHLKRTRAADAYCVRARCAPRRREKTMDRRRKVSIISGGKKPFSSYRKKVGGNGAHCPLKESEEPFHTH